ncbi:MAG: RHS repeat-associated core domain-containing protein [Candidatus Sumerlaeia bacterium]|nr:RHS repeat-associated core domain-containing protein [Candidatus Sumerlaeia bacterium]
MAAGALLAPAVRTTQSVRAPLSAAQSSIGLKFLFTARPWTPVGELYHLRARWYSPLEGRFLTMDPIGYDGGSNVYMYCGGDPVNWVDPWGLERLIEIVIELPPIPTDGIVFLMEDDPVVRSIECRFFVCGFSDEQFDNIEDCLRSKLFSNFLQNLSEPYQSMVLDKISQSPPYEIGGSNEDRRTSSGDPIAGSARRGGSSMTLYPQGSNYDDCYTLLQTVVHELGHSIGLTHDVNSDWMYIDQGVQAGFPNWDYERRNPGYMREH